MPVGVIAIELMSDLCFYGLRCFVFVVCKIFCVSIVAVMRVDIEKCFLRFWVLFIGGCLIGFSVRGFVI